MGSCGISRPGVVIFVTTSTEILLEGSRLAFVSYENKNRGHSVTNLIDGHTARIVLVIVLGIDQFGGQGIFPSESTF